MTFPIVFANVLQPLIDVAKSVMDFFHDNVGLSWGLSIVWAYENRPGAAANAPVRWPADSRLSAADDRPTLS